MKSLFNEVSDIFNSLRPITWLRFWSEMIVAAALSANHSFDFNRFLLGFICLGPILWGAAYMSNDLTDIELDRQHPLKKDRPITLGKLTKKRVVIYIIFLLLLALILGLIINYQFVFIILLLSLSEVLYTSPVFRFKEKAGLDILCNGINSILRFIGGYLTQRSVIIFSTFPLFPLLLFTNIKIVFFLAHRLQSRDLELKNNIKSTIVKVPLSRMQKIIFVLSFLSLVLFFTSIKASNFPVISLVILPMAVIFLIPALIFYFQGKATKLEKDLNFRIYLYFSYFVLSNTLASLILLRS